MKFISPAAWGSIRPSVYDGMRGEDGVMDGWVVHWPGPPWHDFDGSRDDAARMLQAYERYHLSKGWRGIAYDYAIDLEGRIYLCRGTGRSGATSGDYDEDGIPNNAETDAVLLLLGEKQPVSEPMSAAFERLVGWSGRRYMIGHREARGTSTDCPGNRAMAWLHDLRNRPTAPKETPVDHLIAIVVTNDVDDGAARTYKARVDALTGLDVPVLRHPAGNVGHAVLVGAAAKHADDYPSHLTVSGEGRDATGRQIFELVR